MSTRYWFPGTGTTTDPAPTQSADWDDASALQRQYLSSSPSLGGYATADLVDFDATDLSYVLFQFISTPLPADQVILGGQSIKAQVMALEATTDGNLFLAVGIRILSSDGTTEQKIILPVTLDDVELSTTFTNRRFTATAEAGDYTTVAGDLLVVEIGVAGDPSGIGTHTASLRFGADDGTDDFAENDSETAEFNPWIEFSGDVVGPSALPQYQRTILTVDAVDYEYKLAFNNYQAGTDPTITDDYTLNYIPGSRWVNKASRKIFECIRSIEGAADWAQIYPVAGANTFRIQSGEVGTQPIGSALYSVAGQSFSARADGDPDKYKVIGLAAEAIGYLATGTVQSAGLMELTTGQWDAVTGDTGGLTAGTIYWLSPSSLGLITATKPSGGGEWPVKVGLALDATRMVVGIEMNVAAI